MSVIDSYIRFDGEEDPSFGGGVRRAELSIGHVTALPHDDLRGQRQTTPQELADRANAEGILQAVYGDTRTRLLALRETLHDDRFRSIDPQLRRILINRITEIVDSFRYDGTRQPGTALEIPEIAELHLPTRDVLMQFAETAARGVAQAVADV